MSDIRSIRDVLDLSQVELGRKLGLHQTMISRLERGGMPIDERTRLAMAGLLMLAGKPVPDGFLPPATAEAEAA